MKALVAGILSFIIVGALTLAFLVPGTYSLVTGLFVRVDTVAVIAGVIACGIVIYVMFGVALVLAIGIGIAIGSLFEK